jgi:hypothetical protein
VSGPTADTIVGSRCANCDGVLTGPFCAHCGQAVRDLHRPLRSLLSDAFEDVFSLDTRLVRTLRPLLFKPGQVTRAYLSGRRAAHVPPLRAYLIAALIYFGLFTVLQTESPPVYVYTSGTAEAAAVKASSGRNRVTIELPQHVWVGDRRFQEVSARARANPDAFALAIYRNVPRAFFLFVPIFAGMLELFYRKQGYYIDHLVFALYYHAFGFLDFAMLFLLGRAVWLPDLLVRPLRWALVLWLVAYLPLALRRTYGGSWLKTGLKVIGLGVLYLLGFVSIGFSFIMFMAMITF